MAKPRLCLNMIVKDEAHVIERCLSAIKPHVDAWLIVDTGSSDDTPALIEKAMAPLPGRVERRPWKNFGHNRSEALALARDMADYTIVIDADEVLEAPAGWSMPDLTADGYMIANASGLEPPSFYRAQIFANRLPWFYEGVLHEVATCDEAHALERMEGVVFRGLFDSARNQMDHTRKYAIDAATLERALIDEPDNARYVFYLGQSYRNCRQFDRAIAAYSRRVTMGGWEQEVFFSLLQIARVMEMADNTPADELIAAYLAAYERRPSRAEPLYYLARYLRISQRFTLAYLFAEKAAALAEPDDILFVDRSVYRWRAKDELALAAYWIGDKALSARLNRDILASDALPEADRRRIETNLSFAEPPGDQSD